jgi:hypothetical protein
MINAIDNALNMVRTAALQQSNNIVAELSSDFDQRNVALGSFNKAMQEARAMREAADALERDAITAFNSALTSSGSVALSIVNQIKQGQIVTAPEPKARLKEVKSNG